jgi:hypothetical protein
MGRICVDVGSGVSEKLTLVKNEDGSWRSWDDSLDFKSEDLETMEVVPVTAPTTEKDSDGMSVEERVSVSLAVGRYLKRAEEFNAASREFTKACKDLRKCLGTKARLIANINGKHYLVTSDRDGNFDVELVDSAD